MNSTKMTAVLDQAEIVLKSQGFVNFERRSEATEFSDKLTYLVATDNNGRKAEAYPRNTRDGMTYKLYID